MARSSSIQSGPLRQTRPIYGYRYELQAVQCGDQTRLSVVVTPRYGIWQFGLFIVALVALAAYLHLPSMVLIAR